LSLGKGSKEASKNKGGPSASKGLKKALKKSKGGLSVSKGREKEPRRPIIRLREAIFEEEPVKRAKVDTPSACFASLRRE
jgi:hypothetical protein